MDLLCRRKILTYTMYCVLANLKPRQRTNPRIITYRNRTFIRNIDSREADVVRLYFGLGDQHPMTLEEIGETFDLTRERVRQIKEKAIRRLKTHFKSKILKTYLG
jgi:RNA polymerase sigma factor (sigma-70 family)